MGMQAIFGWHLAFGKPRYQWSLEVSGIYSRGIPANSSNEFTSYDDLWSRSACRGYHPFLLSRSIRHNETYATDDVSTFVDQILRFELLVRTLEYLIGDSSHFAILYHALFLVPSFLLRSSFFFFFSFSPLVPCLLLGRVTNYSPRPSKNLISNSPYLWSHRLNISLQTPLSVPLFHAVFSPRSFSSLSRPETLWRERRRDKKGGPCKVIRSDIRKFNRNYATERIQSECRLPKNQ